MFRDRQSSRHVGPLCARYLFGRTHNSCCVDNFDRPKFMLRQRPLFSVIERQKVAVTRLTGFNVLPKNEALDGS